MSSHENSQVRPLETLTVVAQRKHSNKRSALTISLAETPVFPAIAVKHDRPRTGKVHTALPTVNNKYVTSLARHFAIRGPIKFSKECHVFVKRA